MSDTLALWRRHDAMEQRLSTALSARMLALAELQPGMRVLDLACGRGEPAIPAAHAVGAHGSVLGIDADAAVLELARARAEREGLRHIRFEAVAAEQLERLGEAPFDRVLSRWGLMYLADPLAVLRALTRVMRPQGWLVLALWAEPARVDYYTLPRQLLARYTEVEPVRPELPGTFRYSELAVIERDLHASGWQIDQLEEHYVAVAEAETPEALLDWILDFGLRRLLAAQAESVVRAWRLATLEALRALPVSEGCRRLGGVTRVLRARPR